MKSNCSVTSRCVESRDDPAAKAREQDTTDAYDRFAWLYDRRWAAPSAERMLPLVRRLLLDHRPPPARLLDLCCGTGHLSAALVKSGYEVTAVDGSARMIDLARSNAPSAEHVIADARAFERSSAFDAAVCLYDSLNHVEPGELPLVFGHLAASLRAGGDLLFDLNTREGFARRWSGSFASATSEDAFIASSSFDPAAGTAAMRITFFRPSSEAWERSDVTFRQWVHPTDDVVAALTRAGFLDVTVRDAARDLGLSEEIGRAVFTARRP